MERKMKVKCSACKEEYDIPEDSYMGSCKECDWGYLYKIMEDK